MTKKQVIARLKDIEPINAQEEEALTAAIDMLKNAVVFTRCSKQLPKAEDFHPKYKVVNALYRDGSVGDRELDDMPFSENVYAWSRIERPLS